MDEVMDDVSDAVLYRKLYTNILSQQIQAENRLHRLMMTRQDKDHAFDEHLAKVRAKVEKDRMRIQNLGERLVLVERKDMKITSGARNAAKEHKPSVFATLLNMEGLRDQFKLGHNITPSDMEMNKMKVDKTSNNLQKTDSIAPNQSPTIDPKDIEVVFDYPVSQNTNTTPNPSRKPDKQEHSRKFIYPRNYSSFGDSQNLKDGLPKRVSFNDIPDFIAAQQIGNERRHLANQEAGWSSDYSEDEAGSDQLNPFYNQNVKRYDEPPPDLSQYSYKRHVPETSANTTEQGRKYNQGLNKKAEQVRQDKNPQSFLKSPEPTSNHEEIWDLAIEQGNSPFKSPWEGVISTSLKRQRNDSTQAVPSSTTNNEVFLDDWLSGRTAANNQGSTKTAPDTCKTKEISTNTSATTANITETKENKKFEDWLNVHKSHDSKEDIIEDIELQYEHVVKSKHDSRFIKDDALTAMRRQSWTVHSPNNNNKKERTVGRFASMFRRTSTKNKRAPPAELVLGDKKQFRVNKKIRRKMSLRPLPDTPDVIEKNEHVIHFTTADSLDTFHDTQ